MIFISNNKSSSFLDDAYASNGGVNNSAIDLFEGLPYRVCLSNEVNNTLYETILFHENVIIHVRCTNVRILKQTANMSYALPDQLP